MFTTNFYCFMSRLTGKEFLPLLTRPESLIVFDRDDVEDTVTKAIYSFALAEVFNQIYSQTRPRPMTELLSNTVANFERRAKNCIGMLNEFTQLQWHVYYGSNYIAISVYKDYRTERLEYRFLTTDENDVRFLADYIMRISGDEKEND